MTTTDVIIVAAGSGKRLGHSMPKAFVDLCGKPVFYYSLKTFAAHPSIDKIILVVSQDMITAAQSIVNGFANIKDKVKITHGGKERFNSVLNGVMLSSAKHVLIHDAARPFVTADIIDSLLNMRDKFECVITATPQVDTVREIATENLCGKTLDRSKLMRVGTPQMFRREMLLRAFEKIESMTPPPTDEAALFENIGIKIGYVWGDPLNFKITTPADFKIAQALIERNCL